jgi:hypothetical protein
MTYKPTSLFTQIITQIIDAADFRRIVRAHNGDRHSKGLRCRDQLVAMLFLHLSKVTSLREITQGLRCAAGKVIHLGMSKIPGHSTLAYANAHRPWQMYRDLFYSVLGSCAPRLMGGKPFRFKNKLLSMDATFIDLCLSLFPWASFRQTKGAVKIHLLYNHDGYFPVFAHITDGKQSDSVVARQALAHPEVLPSGSIVVFDRGYIDFSLFAMLTQRNISFVTRLKKGMVWSVEYERPVPDHRHIVGDQDLFFSGKAAYRSGQHMLRRVEAVDPETGETVELLTNDWERGASTIAKIYRERWKIEIFFKTLKQHLKIKTFVGTSKNALLIQIWTALICVLALKLLQKLSTYTWSMSNLVTLVQLNLFSYRDLRAWLDHPLTEPPWEPDIQFDLAL